MKILGRDHFNGGTEEDVAKTSDSCRAWGCNMSEKKIKVCLVGSSGGHLNHLFMLKPFWEDKERFWATFDKEDSRSLLEGETIYPVY